ncbi:pimeloyl-ACP methyl ester carboxylesterase [Pseudonocardia eucalypti]|uniref:alpha/beta fold hydrolase n=1 Tax=Pseudonocardia eucalypti TaxID=648755 RepID=UPI00161DEA0D|nr:pimeloyl-ACP methyl ester carboxylesterase [Pseudonocardia eucalypti]
MLLHNLGQRWQVWRPVIDQLAERYDVIAVDLPRLGRAPIPQTTTEDGIRAFGVRSLKRIFDHLEVSRPHVAGCGLGGMLAIAATTTGIVSSATALAPTGFWTPRQRWWVITHLRLFRIAARVSLATDPPLAELSLMRNLLISRLCEHPRRMEPTEALANLTAMRDASAFDEAMASARQFQWRSDPKPLVPLTVAWGERDKLMAPSQMINAEHRLQGAEFVRLPGCGHVAMNDDPGMVARVIVRTCARAERGHSWGSTEVMQTYTRITEGYGRQWRG